MAGTTTTQSVEVPVSLALDAAIRQADNLKRILKESVKPDSSAYRDIENMLNKASRQAQGFKQTMSESLKTSSGTKAFANNLQKTFNLLDLVTDRLGSVKGKDLIFSDADAAQVQQINAQISQVNEQIKQLRKEKVGSLFDDNSIPEFKQLQDLAAKLHKNLSDLTFDDLNNAIEKELKNVDNTITNTTEKIKDLDNVLKNTNLSDLNKITQGLRTQGAANTIEVFKADNLTEAAQRLQAFYQQYSDYTGRMKSKIQEGTSVSKVLDDENKAINSNLSTQIAHLNNYRNQLEEALNTLKGISGHKAGQSREYKRGILNSQSMQDLLRSVGFEEEIPATGDPSGIIMRIREMFTNALNNVQIRAESLTTLRENMLNTLKSVFDGLETEQVVGDNKGFQNSLANWLSGGSVDIKNSGIVQAFNEIKKGSDVTAVINSIAAAVMQYIQSAEQAKTVAVEEIQQQNAYAESLRNAQNAVQQGKQATEEQVAALQEEIKVLKKKIELLEKDNEERLRGQANSDEINEEAQAYRGLIAQLNTYSGALAKTEAQVRALGNIRTAITNWMGFNQILNLVKRAVTDAMNHIKQLDTTMNGIAIVTDMTTADLWKQVDAYSEMAQKFGVTIQGAYEVSKIYYQAGYETNEVLTLTNETLKLSKISGLDYATTTDYMMTAMRGFKLEMEDASRVVDVYSNLAANTAVSQQELAEAMTRTASSMESVGATFEETSAMIATMVAVTRESASNIGSAMKSIASRYGELTKDPAALFDADGEAMSFNKVDTALRSVGITLQTTDHQFRDFTEVIIELAEKWDTLDSAAQRYIATQFAGNRQQSRFLALVSNVDLLKENIANAQNSEDIGTLQALKAMDSLESKLNQVQVAYQQFYTTIGIENVWKGFLDGAKSVIDTLNSLPKLFGAIPLNAVAVIGSAISLVKTIALQGVAQVILQVKNHLKASEGEIVQIAGEVGKNAGQEGVNQANNEIKKANFAQTIKKSAGDIVNSIGSVGVMIGAVMDKTTKSGREAAGVVTGLGGAFQAIGGIVNGLVSGNWVGAILTVATGVTNIINGVSIATETSAEELERLTQEAENLNNEAKKAKVEYNTLDRSIEKINELTLKRNDSIEATKAYNDAVNELADSFPQLVIGFDNVGNAIINMETAEKMLADARQKTANATIASYEAELKQHQLEEQLTRKGAIENIQTQANEYLRLLGFDTQSKYALNNLGMSTNIIKDLNSSTNNKGVQDLQELYQQWLEVGANDLQRLYLEIASFSEEDLKYNNNIQKIYNFQEKINEEIIKGNHEWDFLFKRNDNNDLTPWEQMLNNLQDLSFTSSTIDNDKSKIISSKLNNNERLFNNSFLNQLATNILLASKKSFEQLNQLDYENATNQVLNWWDSLGKSQELVQNIFNNLSNYSIDDIYKILSQSGIENIPTEISEAINNYYDTLGANVSTNVDELERQLDFDILDRQELTAFDNQLGQSILSESIKLINSYVEKGLIKNANDIQEIIRQFVPQIQNISNLDINEENILKNILKDGFSTPEEIENLIKKIENTDWSEETAEIINSEIIPALNSLKDNLVSNYLIGIKAAIDDNTQKFTQDTKTISKLTKGLSLDEMFSFLTSSINTGLEELDRLNFSDFQQDLDGNFTITNERMQEFWSKYIDANYKISDDLKDFYERINSGNPLSDKDLVSLGFDLDEEIDDKEVKDAIDSFNEFYEDYLRQIEETKKSLIAALQFEEGNYSLIDPNVLKEEIRKGTDVKRDDKVLQIAVEKASEAINNYLNDVLEKNIENVDARLYALPTGIPEFKTNVDLIKAFSEYFDTTSAEWNELVVKAIKKDAQQTTGEIQDVLDNVKFVGGVAYASIETIQQIADIFNKNILELYDPDSFNQLLGGYKITNFDFSNIENAKIKVADSVQEFFESLADLIGKGLDGKLSNVDFNNLQQMIESFNLDVNLDFTKTVDGLKLSKQSAIDLYYALREVDSLKAELLFDDIYDSITEAGSGLENISQTTAEIVKLEKEINEAEGDTSGLKERLALLKQIQLTQANNADSYSFMDRKLPEYLQGPENYWNAVGKAFTSMNKAASSGYMEIDDFYNLVNEMTNLANISGNELEFMGQKISGSAEDAAKLINWGFGALSNVDGKGVKISLEKLGTNVFTGAEDMGKGFDDAVEEMARAQIKMLDAQIAMLEAVVAMEQLGDIDINKSGKIDYSEIFDTEGNFTELYKNTAKALVENEKLAPILEQVTISGHTLKELFGLSADELEKLNISKDHWVQIVNALYQMNIGDNWDLENIPQSLREQLAALGQGLTVFNEETKTGWLIDFSGRPYTIKWDSEEEQARLVKAFKDAGIETTFEKAKETLLKGGETGEFSSSQERLAYEIYFGNVDVTIDDSGNKTYHVKGDSNTYDNENSALNALVGLEQQTRGATLKTVNEDGSRTYSLAAGFTYTTNVTATGETVYTAEGIEGEFNSYSELTDAVLKNALPEGTNLSDATEEQLTEAGREAKLLVTPHIEFTETPSELTAEQKSQLLSLAGKTADEIQDWLSATDEDGETNAVKLGLKLNVDPENGNLTKDEFLNILESVGIETKYLNVVANITVGENTTGIQFSEEGITATVDELKVTAEKSVYDGDFSVTEPIENGTAMVNNLSVGATNVIAGSALASLQTLNFASTSQSLLALNTVSSSISNTSFSNFDKLADVMEVIAEEAETIWSYVQQFADKTFTVEMKQTGEGGESVTINVDSVAAAATSLGTICSTMITNLDDVTNSLEDFSDSVSSMSDVLSKLENLSKILATLKGQSNAIESLSSMVSKINNVCRALSNIGRKLDNIPSGVKPLSVKFNYSVSKSSAKGNVALAKGDLEAKAVGTPTLMGELGAELVVSKGRYFLVGQDGAEFVNLDKDAIVFNHLQTQRLLGSGHIGSRGIPFTNERNAVSLAKGRLSGPAHVQPSEKDPNAIKGEDPKTPSSTKPNNTTTTIIRTISEKISGIRVSPTSTTLPLISYAKGNVHGGPAQASASQALAALKQIRAMWQSMLEASAKELGSLAGAGGGGKKGGGGGKDWQEKTTTAEIQRWYNLIRQIAKLEEDITYQETLQAKLASDRVTNGKAMYQSYKQELSMLQQEINANQELAALQKSWYDNKRAELAASDYGKIFTYDENGLQQYVGTGEPGSGLGLDILENLTRRDVYGQAMDNAATARQQLEYLRSVGFNTDNLRFNDDGTFIDLTGLEGEELDNAYVQMMENFWDKVDGWRDELDSIYDSYHEQLEKVLSNQDKQNQILQKIVDNQLAVEQSVLKSIESREQKRIDDAKAERDALADSTDKFLNGLNDQLNREREMYQKQTEQNDLEKLRRQLAILMRSGGAASQIRSLQDQINAKSQDMYFDAQQEQIDALKEASDAQLERLDAQIDLMTETLEYQKNNGLLWQEVYQVMAKTPAEIQSFITNNTPDFQSNSALQVAEDLRELKLQIEQWVEYRNDVNSGKSPMASVGTDWNTYYNSIKSLYNNVDADTEKKAREIYNSTLAATGDPNAAASAAMAELKPFQKVAPTNTASASSIAKLQGGGTGGTVSAAEKVSNIVGILKEGNKGNDVVILQKALNALGYTDNNGTALETDGIFGSKTKQAVRKFQSAMGLSADGIVGDETKEKFRMKGYIKGGIVDYTGLAAVHGTEAEPESFFNAKHTKLLMQDMALREQLLPSLLETYNNILQNNTNHNISPNNGETLNIEHLELTMQVQQMNNDYDARRAAHIFKDELLSISRKSGNISLNRG